MPLQTEALGTGAVSDCALSLTEQEPVLVTNKCGDG